MYIYKRIYAVRSIEIIHKKNLIVFDLFLFSPYSLRNTLLNWKLFVSSNLF